MGFQGFGVSGMVGRTREVGVGPVGPSVLGEAVEYFSGDDDSFALEGCWCIDELVASTGDPLWLERAMPALNSGC